MPMLRSVEAAVSPPIPAPTIANVSFLWPIWYPFLFVRTKTRRPDSSSEDDCITAEARILKARRPASSLEPKQAVELPDDAIALAVFKAGIRAPPDTAKGLTSLEGHGNRSCHSRRPARFTWLAVLRDYLYLRPCYVVYHIRQMVQGLPVPQCEAECRIEF